MKFALLLATACAASMQQQPVKPALHPEADDKFFAKDYPHDMRPTTNTKWQGVYPKLQSHDKYHDDFTKDENADGGHWAAQMTYDELRMKLKKQKEETNNALEKEQQERKEYEKAAEEDKEGDAKAKAAEAEAEAAAKEADEAEQALDDAEKEDGTDKEKKASTVKAAKDRVKAAELNLAGCEKKLQDAQADLEHLKAKKGQAQSAEEQKAEQAQRKADAANAEATALNSKVAQERKEHKAATQGYKKEQSRQDTMEKDLKDAEVDLRKLRGEKVPDEKANLKAEKSSAKGLSAMLAIAAVAATTC